MQKLQYKLHQLKRTFWRSILMRCHKCHQSLEYTQNGRGICVNLACDKA